LDYRKLRIAGPKKLPPVPVTKSKGAFQSEDALMKLLFLVQENICAKWNKPVHNWNQTLAQLSFIFADRLKLNL
jgi:putative transposase